MGGERNERKKWIYTFENVSIILFYVNLQGYDMCLAEDNEVNRLQEDLNLWNEIATCRWFGNTYFFLIFNQKDLFEEKIADGITSLSDCFPDFTAFPTKHAEEVNKFANLLPLPMDLIRLIVNYLYVSIEYAIEFIQNKFFENLPADRVRRIYPFVINSLNAKDIKTICQTMSTLSYQFV